jgi:hypothetical protein
MKSLPPPEEVDPDGGVPTTLVADSDDENEEELVVPAPAPTPVKVEEPVTEEVKPKKKIIKKKTDA